MKIKEAIERTFALRPDSFLIEEKVAWLNELDHKLYLEVILTHENGRKPAPFEHYFVYNCGVCYTPSETETKTEWKQYDPSNLETELLVPAPYDKLYISYLKSKIEEAYGETERYNNSAYIFNNELQDFKAYWNRTHRHR